MWWVLFWFVLLWVKGWLVGVGYRVYWEFDGVEGWLWWGGGVCCCWGGGEGEEVDGEGCWKVWVD